MTLSGHSGDERLEIDGSGDLVAHLPGGEVRFKKPVIYQEADGAKRPVAGGYVLKDGRVTFKVAAYDRTRGFHMFPRVASLRIREAARIVCRSRCIESQRITDAV